ncbi:MAG: cell filamentation protein Fic [Clostridia bacterium]|nr:cell filamentation protein Fic [Clostridia bacterium]
MDNENNIIFYTDEDNNVKIEVILENENVWLTQNSLAKLFDTTRNNITMHIKNIFTDEELEIESVSKENLLTANDGKKYKTKLYNLDMIISLGFRVNSKKAIKFRTWANKIIKEYMIKGFALDDDRFLKGGKVNQKYFDELLERIKVIRTSERMAYQKITDIFMTTSIDYDKNSEEAYTFFKIVQNKLHYAITGHTAAELIYERVDSEKINMGLTTWKEAPDGMIYKYDISVAKNYLNESELKKLNNLTTLFLDYAETMAEEEQIMTMKDWINETDNLLKFRKKEILKDSGRVSHKQAIEKANNEYEKYRIKQDQQYISSMDEMYKKYLEENK